MRRETDASPYSDGRQNAGGHGAKEGGQEGAAYSWAINKLGKLREKTYSGLHRLHYYKEQHSITLNPQGPKSTIRRSAPLNGRGNNNL